MAAVLRSLRVGERPNGYVLPFAQIRSGLWSVEHEERMGEAIWLYGWLHSRVDRRTGTLVGYTHAAAAADSSKGVRSVRARFDRLRREGYISAVRRQYGMDVSITNYRPDGALGSTPDRTSASTLDLQMGSLLPPDGKSTTARWEADVPYIDLQREQREHISTTNVVASAAFPESLAGFDQALRGARGYGPKPGTLAKILEKYGHLDLEEEALKMAGWLATKRTRPASDAFILNWLKGAAGDAAAGRTHGRRNGAHATPGYPAGPDRRLAAEDERRADFARFGVQLDD